MPQITSKFLSLYRVIRFYEIPKARISRRRRILEAMTSGDG